MDHSPLCRFCGLPLLRTFVDLGLSPLCQTQIDAHALASSEIFYPLHVRVCDACWLVQLPECVAPERIFTDTYPYFSSYSASWVDHARQYVDVISNRLGLTAQDLVVEIASNDGYLLQHFLAHDVNVLGVEPTANTAAVARDNGIPTEVVFFGEESAQRLKATYGQARLLVGNNVLAHVPDINDFVRGLRTMLAENGVITMEFPHLMRLIERNQFDTIYHEHFSYFSLGTVFQIFQKHGLAIFDVEELSTHGGSLRIFAQKAGGPNTVAGTVASLIAREKEFGLFDSRCYAAFADRVQRTKRSILSFLTRVTTEGRSVVGYGAPGKGNTLLNYCGIRTDFLAYTVDRSPHKQGTYTPGTRIPILPPEHIQETRPDYLFILPWNLKEEIMAQTAFIRDWGGRWVTPIPDVQIYA